MFSLGRVTQSIILAAGSGSRLNSSDSIPKPLMPVAGQPLLAHALAHARAGGCAEVVIVLGHEAARVRDAADQLAAQAPGMRVRFVLNRDHHAPNGVSLLAAAAHAAPVFFLQMVDHLFAEPALGKLVAQPLEAHEAGRVLVDRAPVGIDLSDATKVCLAERRVTSIGKGLRRWDAIDAGCFVMTPAVFDALRRVPAGEPITVSAGMRQLVAGGALGFADVDGIEWIDVDTPADRAAAETLVQKTREVRV